MSSLLHSIQTDLTALAGEARKKLPAVKDAAERGLLKLRAIDEAKAHEYLIEDIGKAEEVVRACCLTADCKNAKVIGIAVGCVHKIVAHGAVSEKNVPLIIGLLVSQSDGGEEQTQLRVLQTALGLVGMDWPESADVVKQSLEICYRLQAGKSLTVGQAATATIRQIGSMIFDQCDASLKSCAANTSTHTSMTSTRLRICRLYLADNIALATGEATSWLVLRGDWRSLAVELLDHMLQSNTRVIVHEAEMAKIVRDNLCPMLLQPARSKSAFPHMVRQLRLTVACIRHLAAQLGDTSCKLVVSNACCPSLPPAHNHHKIARVQCSDGCRARPARV
jgi:hypothetical protein